MLSYLLIVMFQFTANAQGDEEKKKDGEDEEEEQEEKIEEEEEEFSDDGDYNQVMLVNILLPQMDIHV